MKIKDNSEKLVEIDKIEGKEFLDYIYNGKANKNEVIKVVDRVLKEYGDVIKQLGK